MSKQLDENFGNLFFIVLILYSTKLASYYEINWIYESNYDLILKTVRNGVYVHVNT